MEMTTSIPIVFGVTGHRDLRDEDVAEPEQADHPSIDLGIKAPGENSKRMKAILEENSVKKI